MRSPLRCRPRGCRPPRFCLGVSSGFALGSGIAIEVIVVLVGSGLTFRTPCLPSLLEQRQLLFRQLLTLAVALSFQQLAQQTLILVLLGQGTIQLFGQIHDDFSQRLCIARQAVRIDGHRAFSLKQLRFQVKTIVDRNFLCALAPILRSRSPVASTNSSAGSAVRSCRRALFSTRANRTRPLS